MKPALIQIRQGTSYGVLRAVIVVCAVLAIIGEIIYGAVMLVAALGTGMMPYALVVAGLTGLAVVLTYALYQALVLLIDIADAVIHLVENKERQPGARFGLLGA